MHGTHTIGSSLHVTVGTSRGAPCTIVGGIVGSLRSLERGECGLVASLGAASRGWGQVGL